MEQARAVKILVVDDEANKPSVLAIGLRVEGFDVAIASDLQGTVDVMDGATFDFAIVDLMLHGTNGLQLSRLIRKRFPCVRVVLMSAYHLSERQLVLADCGAVGFVPRPFDLTELAAFLRSKLAVVDSAGEVA